MPTIQRRSKLSSRIAPLQNSSQRREAGRSYSRPGSLPPGPGFIQTDASKWASTRARLANLFLYLDLGLGGEMEYVRLGRTGLRVSRICLGCMTYGEPARGELKGGRHAWALNEEESQPFFRQALDLGINFFDTANVYSSGASEEVLGNFLQTNVRREAVVVATKVYGSMRDEPNGSGLSRKAIFH